MSWPAATWLAAVTWMAAACGLAVLIGIASASVQAAGVAPIAISSLVTGAAVGCGLLASRHSCGVRGNALRWPVLALAVLFVVLAEHAWLYRNYRQRWHQVRDETPAVALFREETDPLPIGQYLTVEATPGRIAFWVVDAALIAAAAAGIVYSYDRRYTGIVATPPKSA